MTEIQFLCKACGRIVSTANEGDPITPSLPRILADYVDHYFMDHVGTLAEEEPEEETDGTD